MNQQKNWKNRKSQKFNRFDYNSNVKNLKFWFNYIFDLIKTKRFRFPSRNSYRFWFNSIQMFIIQVCHLALLYIIRMQLCVFSSHTLNKLTMLNVLFLRFVFADILFLISILFIAFYYGPYLMNLLQKLLQYKSCKCKKWRKMIIKK